VQKKKRKKDETNNLAGADDFFSRAKTKIL